MTFQRQTWRPHNLSVEELENYKIINIMIYVLRTFSAVYMIHKHKQYLLANWVYTPQNGEKCQNGSIIEQSKF